MKTFKGALLCFVLLSLLMQLFTAASAQSVSQTITLKAGYNFAGLTVKPSLTPPVIKSQNSAIEDIYAYSAAAGSFLSVSEGTLNIFNPSAGYIIKSKSDSALTVAGTAIPSTGNINLKSGFNLIGFSKVPETISFSALMTKYTFVKGLYKWNAAAGSFIQVVRNPSGTPEALDSIDPSFAAGQGYFFNLSADAALNYDGASIALTSSAPVTPSKYTLNIAVSPSAAAGTVSVSLAGPYDAGTAVTLTAAAYSGYVFKSWGGTDAVSVVNNQITMNSDKSITAVFETAPVVPSKYNLNIAVSPSTAAGTVSVSLAGPYDAGTAVMMTAEAYLGYAFKSWDGTDAVSVVNNQITMNSDKNITAVFESTAAATSKTITIDASNDLGAFKMIVGTNDGPVSLVKGSDETARYKELGFKNIRTLDYYGPFTWYGIFPDFSKDPELESSYDFSTTDVRVKKLMDEGFEILFSFSPSWNDTTGLKTTHDPPGTIRDAAGNITHEADSADFKKFANICKHIIMHYNAGWKSGYYYNIKRWELWNEPETFEQFWSGTATQFYEMFGELAKTFRAYDPSLIIYGPGNAEIVPPALTAQRGYDSTTYTSKFLEYCKNNGVPIDVYTWHSYGGESMVPSHIKTFADDIRAKLNTYGYNSTAMSCDEWNSGINQANFSNSGKGAAFYGCALAFMLEKGIVESYQYRGDDHPLGIILQTNGQLKTAGYALKAWKQVTESCTQLGSSTTETGEFAVVSSKSSADGSYYAMASNFTTENKTVKLSVANITSPPASGWTVTRKVISDAQLLATAETGAIGPGSEISYTFEIPSYTVALIQFTKK